MTERDAAPGSALDAALAAALPAPPLPADFHAGLRAALERQDAAGFAPAARARLERERLAQLAALEAGYLRVRRRTLGLFIGVAFAAGAGVALMLPWLRTHFGADTPLVLAGLGGAGALAIAILATYERLADWNPLQRL